MPGTLVNDLGTQQSLIIDDATQQAAEQVVNDVDHDRVNVVTLNLGDRQIDLPDNLAHLVFKVIENAAERHTMTLSTTPEELTTTAAADLLGISRPTLMKLIEAGDVPSHKVGTHNRLRTVDVLEFRGRRAKSRRAAFDELRALDEVLEHPEARG